MRSSSRFTLVLLLVAAFFAACTEAQDPVSPQMDVITPEKPRLNDPDSVPEDNVCPTSDGSPCIWV